eukprot:757582-Hanusia_phi.AAC.3
MTEGDAEPFVARQEAQGRKMRGEGLKHSSEGPGRQSTSHSKEKQSLHLKELGREGRCRLFFW